MPVPTTIEAPGTDAQSSALTSMPLESAKTAAQTPVYWLGESAQSVYLYREFREAENRGDPITTAISAMTTEQPLDDDYFNPWQPASSVAASISPDGVITVDISADAFSRPLDAGMARRAVQQLVYTATAAAASSGLISQDEQIQVVILVDGHTGYRAFGQVTLGEPMVRDASLVAPVWVIDPQDGTVFKGHKVTINGRGTARDSTLGWEITAVGDTMSRPVAEPMTGSVKLGQDHAGAFTFSVTLPKGNYELRIFQGDPGAKRSQQQFVDSKDFAVT
ncbi:GerMN domain-containing protein [Arthrobacter pigmenti]